MALLEDDGYSREGEKFDMGDGGSCGDCIFGLFGPVGRCRAGYRPRDPADGTWTVTIAVTSCLPPLRERAILGYSDRTEMAGTTTLGGCGMASFASEREELEALIPIADSSGSSASGSEAF